MGSIVFSTNGARITEHLCGKNKPQPLFQNKDKNAQNR